MFRALRVTRTMSFAVAIAAFTLACANDASVANSPADTSDLARNAGPVTGPVAANECGAPRSGWIFCDDFESDRSSKYFEIDSAGGRFARTPSAGWSGSTGMRGTFAVGDIHGGRLSLAFGRVPSSYFRTVDGGTTKYRELYWRLFVRRETGWVGSGPGNLTRAMIFANANWAQALLAVAASDGADASYLRLDGYSGTDASGQLRTTIYNDAANFRTLTSQRSGTPIDAASSIGQWQCYEFHLKLNSAGQSNGVYEVSVNGQLSSRATGLNWVGSYSTYGINSLNVENYSPAAATAANVRTFDNLVVSTSPIGCGSMTQTPPPPPSVASVTVAIDSSSITVAHTAQATATLRDSTGSVLSGTVTWTSSNTAVATVSSAGVVTAVGAGSANIVASNGNKSGQATIQVSAAPIVVGSVGVSLAATSITTGATTQATAMVFDASGNVLTGQAVTWSSSNTAVATVSNAGLVTAVATGSANIIATSGGKSGQAALTVSPIPVASVSVSLASGSLTAGGTTQATATTRDAGGNVLTGRPVTWSSSNTAVATVSATGLVTAVASGSANIVATSGGVSGQAPLSVAAAQAPVASIGVSLGASSLAPGATTQATATTKDASGNVLTGRPLTWSSSNTAVATVSSTGLVTAVAAGSANVIATSGVSGQAVLTVTTPPPPSPPSTILFEEHFEDTNLAARGWYDLVGTVPLSSVEHIPGSTQSAQVSFAAGGTTPSPTPAGRHLFTPTNSLYVRYWVKYSSNWVGSGKSYHPHEFYVLSNLDAQYDGPAYNYLTMYIENNFQNGVGTPTIGSQDGRNVDVTHINVDLTNISENRAVSGCNGDPEGLSGCYQSGSLWINGRTWRAAQAMFSSTAGPNYKANWHKVEAYFQMNSIVNGKAQPDGVVQSWFDGQLVIDRHTVFLRTGQHPNLQFNQLFFGPYIGDGSPVAQTAWFDDLSVQDGATSESVVRSQIPD